VQVDLEGPFAVLPNDIYVLCSDGLSNQVTDPEIGAIARELSPSQACRLMVQIANLRGGPDNSTVVLARVGELPANIPPPSPEPVEERPGALGWTWLIAFWLLGLGLVFGIVLWLMRRPWAGVSLTGLSATGIVILLLKALSLQRKARRREVDNEDMHRTNLSRPHRTAVSLTSTELFQLLTDIELELRRSATEENWNIDTKAHSDALLAAEQAQREKRYGRGCRDLARAIDTLSAQMPKRSTKPAST